MNQIPVILLKMLSGFILLVLPGWAAIRLLRQPGRFRPEALFDTVLCSVLISSLAALSLAVFGVFSLGRVLLIALATCIALLIRGRAGGARDPVPRTGGPVMVTLLALFALCIVLFFRPHEYLGGGWDPGTYLQTGASIAEKGAINYRDSFFASLSAPERALFTHHPELRPERLPGFRITRPGAGQISPQFYHLYPCWLAMAIQLISLRAALFVNPLFALLSVAAVGLAARRILGARTGLFASLLLAANIAQIWFAGFSTAEILTQFFLWSAVYAFSVHISESRSKGYGILAALALGAACLTRITALLALPPFVIIGSWRMLSGQSRRDRLFLLVLALMSATAIAYNQLVAHGYISLQWYVVGFVRTFWPELLLSTVLAALACRKPVVARAWLGRLGSSRGFRFGAMAAVLMLALAAYFVRPRTGAGWMSSAPLGGDALNRTLANAASFREMAWVVTPLGIALAVFATCRLVWTKLSQTTALLWLLVLGFAVFFFADRRVEPFYMFALRRYVPVVIPGFAVFIAYALAQVSDHFGRAGRAIALVLLAALACVPFARQREIVAQRDFIGMVDFCAAVADAVPADESAVTITDDAWLAAPLQFFHGRRCLAVAGGSPRIYAQLEQVLAKWVGDGRRVHYITRGDQPLGTQLHFEPLASVPFRSSRLEQTIGRLPQSTIMRHADPQIYRVELRTGQNTAAPGRRILVGDSFFGIGPGFLRPSSRALAPLDYRWTDGNASVELPAFDPAAAESLFLRLGNPRPPDQEPTPVNVRLDGTTLVELNVPPGGFATYRAPLPTVEKAIRIEIQSPTWSPPADNRRLGIMVDWIAIADAAGTAEVFNIGQRERGPTTGFHETEEAAEQLVFSRAVREVLDQAQLTVIVPGNGPLRLRIYAGTALPMGDTIRFRIRLDEEDIGAVDVTRHFAMHELLFTPARDRKPGSRATLHMIQDPRPPEPTKSGVVVDWIELTRRGQPF